MPFSNLAIQNPYESQIGTPIFLSISKDQIQNVSLKNKKGGTFSKTDRFFPSSIQFSFVIFTSFVLSFPMHCSLTLKKPFCIFFISLSSISNQLLEGISGIYEQLTPLQFLFIEKPAQILQIPSSIFKCCF